MDAYRVTMTRHRKLGLREWNEKKTVPLATRQRVACILNYQAELPGDERWTIKIERAPIIDDWQPVDFTLPDPNESYDRRGRVQLARLPG